MVDIISPAQSNAIFNKEELSSAQFSCLNATLADMLRVYAGSLLSPDLLETLCSKEESSVEEPSAVLYIFGPKHYDKFLQMIAKENYMHSGKLVYTIDSKICYSDSKGISFSDCPTYSLADQEKFLKEICNSEYAKAFSKHHTHLVRTATKISTVGKMSSKLIEYCLYLPK